jgi:hypothetical protein
MSGAPDANVSPVSEEKLCLFVRMKFPKVPHCKILL